MPEIPHAFGGEERRIEFFDRLSDLLDDFPELQTRMQRSHQNDPSDDHWYDEDGEDFDPQSPTLRTGIVLVIAHANMQMWEDISFLEPPHQSRFLTVGLLTEALDVT